MAVSQNGYKANARNLIATYTVPGTDIRVSLRKGDVSVVLLEVLRLYHTTVEPLHREDTGGYAERVIRGGVSLSNHASGTAVDTRWNKHPLGARGTFNTKQRKAINAILAKMDGVVRWGGNYKSRADEMHWEIVGTPAQVKQVADELRRPKPVVLPKKQMATATRDTLKRGDSNSDVKSLQRDMNRVFPAYSKLSVDGSFGPATERVVREFQRRAGLPDDGVVGPNTKRKLRVYGIHVRG